MTAGTYHQLGAIRLPRGMRWVDEFGDWALMERGHERSLTGAQLIDVAAKQHGRPITLSSDPDQGWIRRSVLQDLRALSEAPETTHTLTLADGRTFAVRFAPDTAPVTATPVSSPELPEADHPYIATLRLVTTQPPAPEPEP